jgi:tRNA modification GTPase
VLVGPPNAGKSRLFNALLGANRALVSPIPGTTRDYLSAHLDCDGLSVELIDTAGEDTAQTTIEATAQSLRANQAARADLLLDCYPADRDARESSLVTDVPSSFAAAPARLHIRTKSDLGRVSLADPGALSTSAATGEGLETLRARIAAALRCQHSGEDLCATTGARCRDSLLRASESLASASRQVTLGAGEELISVELRQAVDELGKVFGAVVTEDILDRIFSKFCIGK